MDVGVINSADARRPPKNKSPPSGRLDGLSLT
jgi:hypothetical protein